MSQRQIEELLSQQADRLAAGQQPAGGSRSAELTSMDRAGLSVDEQRALTGLMQLARRVQSAMAEVEPRPAFVADLRSRLLAERRAEIRSANGGRGRRWVWGVAGLAGALSLAGLGILGYRAMAASRAARPALPKA